MTRKLVLPVGVEVAQNIIQLLLAIGLSAMGENAGKFALMLNPEWSCKSHGL